MKKIILFLTAITLVVLISGCGTMGSFRANNVTNVELSQPNFNYVARDLQGTAMQGYLFGVSAPQGQDMLSFGIVRVSGVENPNAHALKELWNAYRAMHGDTDGKKLALVNIRQDTETLNLIVYTEAKYIITADVIEFIE